MKVRTKSSNSAFFAGPAISWLTRLRATHIWFGATFGLMLLVSLYDGARMVAAQSDPHGKLGEGVLDVLRADGEASVIIMLKPPRSMAESDIAMTELKTDVASLQDRVLSNLHPSEFVVRRRYDAVPAVAGAITSESGLEKLLAAPSVIRIDLDVGGSGSLATTVPLIGADQRHALNNTGEGVVVAILDTGLDTDHGDLADDLIREECFLDFDGAIDGMGRCPNGSDRQSGPGAAEDGAGHGTATTGIVTSRGTISSVGVAPDADIVAMKVLDDTPFAGRFEFFSEIVAALDFIINNPQLGVSVINMSLGTGDLFAGDCDNSTAFNMAGAAAINTLRANGVIAFASSDNDGSGTQMSSPACLSNVVSVGATDNADNVAGLTNSNASTDIMAPGVNITSTGLANGVVVGINGTSFASPHAAGCAALLIEAMDAESPNAIEARLETSPVQVTDPTNGLTFPRIDCSADEILVAVDILPRRCPNRFPVAEGRTFRLLATILGTDEFDVADVDVDTLRIGGAAPLSTPLTGRIFDVATPFEPFIGRQDALDCTREGRDGFDDLILLFDSRSIADGFGPVSDGDVVIVPLTGELIDGTPIRGEDVVLIRAPRFKA